MNKLYKTVWSAHAQGFVVASEHAKGRVKSSSKAVRGAVIAVAMTAAAQAYAAPPECQSGSTFSCEVLTGDLFENSAGVTLSGEVMVEDGASVVSAFGTITNAGTVISGTGTIGAIAAQPGGSIVATGVGGIAIYLNNAVVTNILNEGTIQAGDAGYGIKVTNGTALYDIANNAPLTVGNAGIGIDVDATSSINQINIGGSINSPYFAISADGMVSSINIDGLHPVIVGDVYAPTASVSVDNGPGMGTTFTVQNAFQVNLFSVATNSTLIFGNTPSSSAILAQAITATSGFNNAGKVEVPAGQTAHIVGNYTQMPGGKLEFDVASNASYGKLNVSGTATFQPNAAIILNVTNPSFSFSSAALTGLITAGTLNANGFTLTDNSALFNFTVVQNGNQIDLVPVNADGSSISGGGGGGGGSTGDTTTSDDANSVRSIVSANGNAAARGVAPVLDQFISNFVSNGTTGSTDLDQVVSALGRLTTTAQVNTAAKQTLPVIAGNQTSGVQSALNESQGAITSRQNATSGVSTGDAMQSDRSLWVKPFGSHANQGDVDGSVGFQANTFGVVFGADTDVTSLDRLGVAFAYGDSHINGGDSDAPSSADVDSYQAILYGTHKIDAITNLNFQADIGYHHTDGDRYINFGGLNRDANSGFGGFSGHLGAALGRTVSIGRSATVTPRVSADYTYIRDSGYTESGADSLNLNVGSASTQALVFRLGSLLEQPINDRLSVTLDAAAGYDAFARQNLITSNFVGGGAAFQTYGVTPSHWLLDGGVGLHGTIKEGMTISLDYNVEGRERYVDQSVSAKFRMAF